jgi:hypothetical protein
MLGEKEALKLNMSFYKSARSEIIARIHLRDRGLIAYTTIIGAYFSFVLLQHFVKPPSETDLGYAMLIMLPTSFICISFACLILHHHIAIGDLANYIRYELRFSDDEAENERIKRTFFHFDNSNTLHTHSRQTLKYRHYAQATLLTLPMFYIIPFDWRFYGIARSSPTFYNLLIAISVFEFLCVFAVWLLHMRTTNARLMSQEQFYRLHRGPRSRSGRRTSGQPTITALEIEPAAVLGKIVR